MFGWKRRYYEVIELWRAEARRRREAEDALFYRKGKDCQRCEFYKDGKCIKQEKA